LLIGLWAVPAPAHDIPNEQVDRSIQATVYPGRLAVDYEVSLAELTLAQDLRRLVGVVPGADRAELFDRYGREVGPLNAKGILATVDGEAIDLRCLGFDLVVEGHPRYIFHLEVPLPARGHLVVHDTNYVESKGTSRLAVRTLGGASIRGDDLPHDVSEIPIRPSWQLTDAEERRTRRAEVDFSSAPTTVATSPAPRVTPTPVHRVAPASGLAGLLDRGFGLPLVIAAALAFGLGVAHTIQPGHGKTLVAAAVAGGQGRPLDGVVLAVVTTIAHMATVLAVAAVLWLTRSTRYEAWNVALARVAGFAIATVGFWKLGRHLAGYGEHEVGDVEPSAPVGRGLLGLGLAGGLVPCWDAILLIALAEASGRLPLGLILLLAFSLGMAAVLVAVGLTAARLRGLVARRDPDSPWPRRLGLASGLALAVIGLGSLAA
jgi:cytochrome c biogenesis protein CcdA